MYVVYVMLQVLAVKKQPRSDVSLSHNDEM